MVRVSCACILAYYTQLDISFSSPTFLHVLGLFIGNLKEIWPQVWVILTLCFIMHM